MDGFYRRHHVTPELWLLHRASTKSFLKKSSFFENKFSEIHFLSDHSPNLLQQLQIDIRILSWIFMKIESIPFKIMRGTWLTLIVNFLLVIVTLRNISHFLCLKKRDFYSCHIFSKINFRPPFCQTKNVDENGCFWKILINSFFTGSFPKNYTSTHHAYKNTQLKFRNNPTSRFWDNAGSMYLGRF